MCFGDKKQKEVTTTNTPDPMVQGATRQNLDWLSGVQTAGFPTPPSDRVADFGPLQNQAFNMAGSTAGDPDYLSRARALVDQYSSNPAGHVLTRNISEGIPEYISSHIREAVDPQLRDLEEQRNRAIAGARSGATMAGAFGDPRAAIEEDLVHKRFDEGRRGLIGTAYNQAFDRAIGASAQDVANYMNAQQANAGLGETWLNRMLGGANALLGTQRGQLDVAGMLNQLGMLQTQRDQALKNVPFQDWLMKNMQWIPMIGQLMNQSISAGTKGLPSTSNQVTSAPDNSGLGFLGSIAGTAATDFLLPMMFSDERVKEDIEQAGELFDGTPIYLYRYKGDDTPRIGLIAQDVEKTNPDAVAEIGGIKAVDYEKATRPSRELMFAKAFGLAA